jgi:hypothetical protein
VEDDDLPYSGIDDLAMSRYKRLKMQIAHGASGKASKLNVCPSCRAGNRNLDTVDVIHLQFSKRLAGSDLACHFCSHFSVRHYLIIQRLAAAQNRLTGALGCRRGCNERRL